MNFWAATAKCTALAVILASFPQGLMGQGNPPTPLFDGKSLSGWTAVFAGGSEGTPVESVWSVKNGELHCTGKPNGYVRTNRTYRDFHLTLQWKWLAEPGNSGVLLRAAMPDKVWPKCLEAQLMNQQAGSMVFLGDNISVISRMRNASEKPVGEWNSYDIRVQGDLAVYIVNGVVQYRGRSNQVLEAGHIGLQSEGAPIAFRNIQITEL